MAESHRVPHAIRNTHQHDEGGGSYLTAPPRFARGAGYFRKKLRLNFGRFFLICANGGITSLSACNTGTRARIIVRKTPWLSRSSARLVALRSRVRAHTEVQAYSSRIFLRMWVHSSLVGAAGCLQISRSLFQIRVCPRCRDSGCASTSSGPGPAGASPPAAFYFSSFLLLLCC